MIQRFHSQLFCGHQKIYDPKHLYKHVCNRHDPKHLYKHVYSKWPKSGNNPNVQPKKNDKHSVVQSFNELLLSNKKTYKCHEMPCMDLKSLCCMKEGQEKSKYNVLPHFDEVRKRAKVIMKSYKITLEFQRWWRREQTDQKKSAMKLWG